MKIVIDISEDVYNRCREYRLQCGEAEVLESAVARGTPLPKGHGRIADIDEILEEMKITRTYDIPFALGRVKPIIEADTESEG